MNENIHHNLLEIAENEENLFREVESKELFELMELYKLTNEEAVIFSFLLKFHLNKRTIYLEKFVSNNIKKGDKNYIRILKKMRNMEKKGVIVINKYDYIRKRSYDPINPEIRIEESVILKVVLGEDFFSSVNFDDTFSILENMEELISNRIDKNITESKFFLDVNTFVKKMNKSLPITQIVSKYSELEKAMIFRACFIKLEGGRADDSSSFISGIYDSLRSISNSIENVINKRLRTIKDGVINISEKSRNYGYVSANVFEISDKYYEKIFQTKRKNKNKELRTSFTEYIKYKKLNKELYFDGYLKKNVDILSTALENKQFKIISKRLKNEGFPSGVVSLLYGYPGTGKTATVHKIANLTKRDILQVDISNINDKYVGESEKRLKEVFNEYRRAIDILPKVPILLFNEADALIGKRIDVARSVDQMRNNMQNILLEELEKFDGIFFATTNLTKNMDDAFSRRFLYKVKFEKPSIEIREKIWESKMSNISKDWIAKLSQFDLTGGQIDNIVRKFMIDEMLMLNSGLDDLEKMCRDESSFKKKKIRSIGFRKQEYCDENN